jgi:hypothetical protein
LRARGCRFGQGYFLAPPMPAEQALQLLQAEPEMAGATLSGSNYDRSDYVGSGVTTDGAAVTIH